MTTTAKIFTSGGSQAVRLPAEFRFTVDQVFIRRDEASGDLILSTRPANSWQQFMAVRDAMRAVPDDFLADREQPPSSGRDPFADWEE